MRIRRTRTTAVLAVPLALLLVSCSGGKDGAGSDEAAGGRASGSAASAAPEAGTPTGPRAPGPEKVRDAFAGLQATLDDSCGTPGNCEYLLGRIADELDRLDRAMKADPKGPGHFPEPIAWIADLREQMGEDRSYENLKEHQDRLFGTRDRINTWMQDHPDDYR
ncbi:MULTISPECIES: hypothetical protein [Streptomyces]|uniref:Lipoprotein n=1 Tax=Streptomyces desertarenae TaxID=2666184 RepID=A0ABW4PDN5_9ACTN